MTQCERIKRHLERFGSITPLEAMSDYGIMRLASRINELRKTGMNITAHTSTGKNRFGEKTHYAIYFFEGD